MGVGGVEGGGVVEASAAELLDELLADGGDLVDGAEGDGAVAQLELVDGADLRLVVLLVLADLDLQLALVVLLLDFFNFIQQQVPAAGAGPPAPLPTARVASGNPPRVARAARPRQVARTVTRPHHFPGRTFGLQTQEQLAGLPARSHEGRLA